ncbi:MAG: serine hydrolase [Flavobacteriaceae bacterium]|nr:serine hydrolase [Flavobacteriaceae bacterium]
MDSVLTIIEKDELFHGQILIAEHGNIVFHKSYGTLPGQDVPITTSTSLAVKSITKAFTAAAILKLEQEGKLVLSDTVKKYFPEWPYEGITIKQLLAMTSGLPSFIEKAVNVVDTTKFLNNAAIVKLVSENIFPVEAPGAHYNYQNSNYIVLAALVEKVSGMPYEAYATKAIFEPLDLKHTYFEDLTQISDTINGDTFFAPSGDGNLYSTAEDLYRFEQAFYSNTLLSEENRKATFSKTLLKDGSLSNYGLAWWVVDDAAPKEYYIVGDGPNKRASIQRYPENHSTLIYIHNFSGSYWKGVYWVVRNIWFGNDFTMPTKKEELTPYAIDTKLYTHYVGSYLTKSFGLLHISVENGTLYLRPDPIPGKEALIPSSATTFYFKDQSVQWEFFLDEEGNVKGFGLKGKPESMGEKQ